VQIITTDFLPFLVLRLLPESFAAGPSNGVAIQYLLNLECIHHIFRRYFLKLLILQKEIALLEVFNQAKHVFLLFLYCVKVVG